MAVVVVALAIGFFIGTWRSGATIHTGRADSMAGGGGSIITDDWTYGFGADVTWIDTGNTWHENGIPDCLPPGSSVEGVRFASVEVTVEGSTWRPVVWIDCRSGSHLPEGGTPERADRHIECPTSPSVIHAHSHKELRPYCQVLGSLGS